MKSMTGFARAEGNDASTTWYVELRSVNGRGLDVRFRLPPSSDALEAKMREAVTKRVARGNVNVSLQVDRVAVGPQIRLNEVALSQVMVAASRVRELTGAPAPTVEGLLALRGVLEVSEPHESEAEKAARTSAILATFETALERFIEARAAEGGRLRAIIAGGLEEIEGHLAKVASGGGADRHAGRRGGGGAAVARSHTGCARFARRGSTDGPQVRLPGAGVQPRGQHAVFEGERSRYLALGSCHEGADRSDA